MKNIFLELSLFLFCLIPFHLTYASPASPLVGIQILGIPIIGGHFKIAIETAPQVPPVLTVLTIIRDTKGYLALGFVEESVTAVSPTKFELDYSVTSAIDPSKIYIVTDIGLRYQEAWREITCFSGILPLSPDLYYCQPNWTETGIKIPRISVAH